MSKELRDALNRIDLTKEKKDELFTKIQNNSELEIQENKYRRRGLIMNKKILGGISALGLIAIGGVFVVNSSNSPITENLSPPVGQDVSGEYVVAEEFTNFDIKKIEKNTKNIEIKDHYDMNEVGFVDGVDTINAIIEELKSATPKEMSDEVYEKIATSQANGNSTVMRFVLNDGTQSTVRTNLDLNIACINEEYYEISRNLTDLIMDNIDTKNMKSNGIVN